MLNKNKLAAIENIFGNLFFNPWKNTYDADNNILIKYAVLTTAFNTL